jgi:hypothetical protein
MVIPGYDPLLAAPEEKDYLEAERYLKISGSLDSIYQTRYWSGEWKLITNCSRNYLL